MPEGTNEELQTSEQRHGGRTFTPHSLTFGKKKSFNEDRAYVSMTDIQLQIEKFKIERLTVSIMLHNNRDYNDRMFRRE